MQSYYSLQSLASQRHAELAAAAEQHRAARSVRRRRAPRDAATRTRLHLTRAPLPARA
jgi:hypothetical protein